MEKRLGLALVLFLLLMVVHNWLFPTSRPSPEAARPSVDADGGAAGEVGDEPVKGDSETGTDTDGTGAGGEETNASYDATPSDLKQETIELETDLYLARFSNLGGSLESLKFKTFYDAPEVQEDPALRDDPTRWLEILYPVRKGVNSFTIKEAGEGGRRLDEIRWTHELEDLENGGRRLTFTYRAPDGLIYRKAFTLRDGAYHLDLELGVSNRNPETDRNLLLIMEGPCGVLDVKRSSWTEGPSGVIYSSDRTKDGVSKNIETKPAEKLDEPFRWIWRDDTDLVYGGVTNLHFGLLLQPLQGTLVHQFSVSRLLDSSKVEAKVDEFMGRYGRDPSAGELKGLEAECYTNVKAAMQLKLKVPKPGKEHEKVQSLRFFVGPRSKNLMVERPEDYGVFYSLIEHTYGSFAWINKSLLWILELFFGLVRNWGVAIILLTVVVKAILFPLNRMQQVTMHTYGEKMKRLKPKLDELKKKHKNNRKKFNEAQMRLMKEEGVRPPLLGCLVIFLQFPVFIGLFQILRSSFELRHAPFCLWVKDLSLPDALVDLPFTVPFFGWTTLNVLPILMTVAFYYQQKMMPKPGAGDAQAEQMQKVMKFMPIVFGFMFYNYASGLSLYWMTSNLITILEYRFIRKRFPVGGPNGGGIPVTGKAAPGNPSASDVSQSGKGAKREKRKR